jgi:hypothetical protein
MGIYKGAAVFTAASVALAMLYSVGGASGVTAKSAASIRIASKNPVETKDVWTTFARAGFASATVTGTVSGVADGAVARLYESTFPFKSPPVPVSTSTLSVTSGSARFSFTATPKFETRYRVEVFASASAGAPAASSASKTVYVTDSSVSSNTDHCSGRQCTIHINLTEIIQQSAVSIEKAKHQFLYLSLPAAPGGVKPKPTAYHLVSATVSAPTVKGEHVSFKISIKYTAPTGSYWYYWVSCTRDTLTKDGVGLPGHHGCGDASLSPSTPYVG